MQTQLLLLTVICCCLSAAEDHGPRPHPPRVWLHLGLAACYPGSAVMLKHYFRHYFDMLGFDPSTFSCSVNYHGNTTQAQVELAAVMGVLNERNVSCRLWDGEYLAARDLRLRTVQLARRGVRLRDWVVVTDQDEFQAYPYLPAPKYILDMDSQGYNVLPGRLVDRLAADGSLPELRPGTSLQAQYPLRCEVTGTIVGGWTSKILASKAYWRTDDGNHYPILSYSLAKQHYYAQSRAFNATPYWRYPKCYSMAPWPFNQAIEWHPRMTAPDLVAQPPGCAKPLGPCGCSKYIARPHPSVLEVDHYKWHAGVLPNLKRRLVHFRGDDIGGRPRVEYYKTIEKVVEYLLLHNLKFQTSDVNCSDASGSVATAASGSGGGGGSVRLQ